MQGLGSMTRAREIFYAGDGSAFGPARYLLAILKSAGVKAFHVPPGQAIKKTDLRRSFDAYIFSDYSYCKLPSECEKLIAQHIKNGAGLLMVGGWGSFSGPFGGWRGSAIETLLPVKCLAGDDRYHFPSGFWIQPAAEHKLLKGLSWNQPPVICGLNKVKVRKTSRTILSADELVRKSASLASISVPHPLLVVDGDPQNRRAAFLTDFAPHWAAGFLDWGAIVKIKSPDFGEVQVGSYYLQFGVSLVRWLLGR